MMALPAKALICLVAVLGAAAAAMAAEPIDGEKFGRCLMDNSTEADIENFKFFMVAAMQDNTAEVKSRLGALSATIIRISLGNCNLKVEQFQDPGFQEGSKKYGELLGMKVMQDAFAKIK